MSEDSNSWLDNLEKSIVDNSKDLSTFAGTTWEDWTNREPSQRKLDPNRTEQEKRRQRNKKYRPNDYLLSRYENMKDRLRESERALERQETDDEVAIASRIWDAAFQSGEEYSEAEVRKQVQERVEAREIAIRDGLANYDRVKKDFDALTGKGLDALSYDADAMKDSPEMVTERVTKGYTMFTPNMYMWQEGISKKELQTMVTAKAFEMNIDLDDVTTQEENWNTVYHTLPRVMSYGGRSKLWKGMSNFDTFLYTVNVPGRAVAAGVGAHVKNIIEKAGEYEEEQGGVSDAESALEYGPVKLSSVYGAWKEGKITAGDTLEKSMTAAYNAVTSMQTQSADDYESVLQEINYQYLAPYRAELRKEDAELGHHRSAWEIEEEAHKLADKDREKRGVYNTLKFMQEHPVASSFAVQVIGDPLNLVPVGKIAGGLADAAKRSELVGPLVRLSGRETQKLGKYFSSYVPEARELDIIAANVGETSVDIFTQAKAKTLAAELRANRSLAQRSKNMFMNRAKRTVNSFSRHSEAERRVLLDMVFAGGKPTVEMATEGYKLDKGALDLFNMTSAAKELEIIHKIPEKAQLGTFIKEMLKKYPDANTQVIMREATERFSRNLGAYHEAKGMGQVLRGESPFLHSVSAENLAPEAVTHLYDTRIKVSSAKGAVKKLSAKITDLKETRKLKAAEKQAIKDQYGGLIERATSPGMKKVMQQDMGDALREVGVPSKEEISGLLAKRDTLEVAQEAAVAERKAATKALADILEEAGVGLAKDESKRMGIKYSALSPQDRAFWVHISGDADAANKAIVLPDGILGIIKQLRASGAELKPGHDLVEGIGEMYRGSFNSWRKALTVGRYAFSPANAASAPWFAFQRNGMKAISPANLKLANTLSAMPLFRPGHWQYDRLAKRIFTMNDGTKITYGELLRSIEEAGLTGLVGARMNVEKGVGVASGAGRVFRGATDKVSRVIDNPTLSRAVAGSGESVARGGEFFSEYIGPEMLAKVGKGRGRIADFSLEGASQHSENFQHILTVLEDIKALGKEGLTKGADGSMRLTDDAMRQINTANADSAGDFARSGSGVLDKFLAPSMGFYSWARWIIPFSLKTMANNPEMLSKYAALRRSYENSMPGESTFGPRVKSDYQESAGALPDAGQWFTKQLRNKHQSTWGDFAKQFPRALANMEGDQWAQMVVDVPQLAALAYLPNIHNINADEKLMDIMGPAVSLMAEGMFNKDSIGRKSDFYTAAKRVGGDIAFSTLRTWWSTYDYYHQLKLEQQLDDPEEQYYKDSQKAYAVMAAQMSGWPAWLPAALARYKAGMPAAEAAMPGFVGLPIGAKVNTVDAVKSGWRNATDAAGGTSKAARGSGYEAGLEQDFDQWTGRTKKKNKE